jgi:hypothetical protein
MIMEITNNAAHCSVELPMRSVQVQTNDKIDITCPDQRQPSQSSERDKYFTCPRQFVCEYSIEERGSDDSSQKTNEQHSGPRQAAHDVRIAVGLL